ncbi:MAG: MurR/RpiR family transcriptional regulator [Oscillospiraceae bacterium]|nr:MurR/RpiR family transcriptional regulator [Oscillospiraceae bacterium]
MSLLVKMRQIKDLSPSERHIVDYIFENLDDIFNIGIVELAEKTFTSTATVKRLCKKLGVDSYIDFRLRLSSELSNYSTDSILESATTPVGRYDSTDEIIKKVSNQNAKSIIDTMNLNSAETLDSVIVEMSRAARIDFYGVGPSNVVAEDAQIKCMRIGIPASAYKDRISMLINAKAYTQGTLAFLISYTGMTDEIIEVTSELVREGVPTVSLTSFGENELSKMCKYNLFVDASESWDRLGGMSSRISTLNMIDVLFTALINANYEKHKGSMDHTNVSSIKKES